MSATSLGGSMNVVSSNDIVLKESIAQVMTRLALDFIFPIAKYLPFILPGQSLTLLKMTEDILATRKAMIAEKVEVKKGLFQIILNNHYADPVLYPETRVRDKMIMLMHISPIPLFATISYRTPGLLERTLLATHLHVRCDCSLITPQN